MRRFAFALDEVLEKLGHPVEDLLPGEVAYLEELVLPSYSPELSQAELQTLVEKALGTLLTFPCAVD